MSIDKRLFILEDRKPVQARNLMAWARWMETGDRRVAFSTLADGSTVSTVFLGLDHSWNNGPPVLFETCIFYDESTVVPEELFGRLCGSSEVQTRYCTWAEAELGHQAIVETLSVALHLPMVPKEATQ
jgi:hypothetical protein